MFSFLDNYAWLINDKVDDKVLVAKTQRNYILYFSSRLGVLVAKRKNLTI